MNIAIFDENADQRELISFYIEDYCEKHLLIRQIFLFDTLPRLLCQALSGKFDLIFYILNSTFF